MERTLRLPRVSDGDTFDVVVAGGGASGLIAGVAAARLGARSLLIEASGAFGGAATRNMVAQWLGFYNGEECAVRGLPLEFADRLVKRGGSIGFERYVLAEATTNPLPLRRFAFNPEIVKILADELVVESGAAALLHSRVVSLEKRADRIVSVGIETEGGRLTIAGRCFIDASGDAVLARQAGAPCVGVPSGEHRMGMSQVFRLSGVDIDAFRAVSRADKRAVALEGIASGDLFWDVLSVAPVGSSDAICLMSHLDGFDSLDPSDLTQAELIGRYQVDRIATYLKARMPGFERSEIAGIASHIGVRESVRLEGDYQLTEHDVVTAARFEDFYRSRLRPLGRPRGRGSASTLHAAETVPNPIALHDDEFGEEFARHRACDVRDAGSERRNPSPGNSHGVGAGRRTCRGGGPSAGRRLHSRRCHRGSGKLARLGGNLRTEPDEGAGGCR